MQGDEKRNVRLYFVLLIAHAMAFSTLRAQGSSAEGSPVPERQPLAVADMRWDESAQRFEGRVVYEWSDQGPMEFAVYPNRYLHWEGESRQDREFNSISPPGEDFSLADRSGAFVLKKVAGWKGVEFSSCSERLLLSLLKPSGVDGNQLPIEHWLGPVETSLKVSRVADPDGLRAEPLGTSCEALMIDFLFYPPESEGNFGRDGGNHHYVGPLVPIQLRRFHKTRLLFRDMVGFCTQCWTTSDGLVQEYAHLPSPVHLQMSRSRGAVDLADVGRLDVGGATVYYSRGTDPALRQKALAIIQRVLERSQEPEISQMHTFEFTVYFDLLMRKLSLTQSGEIQLGRAFLKVNPLFEKYHEAALVRSLLVLKYYNQFAARFSIHGYRDYVFVRNISEHLAAHRVDQWFDSLDGVHELSNSLSFIPLFDDILEGKALINNDVFLGRPEQPDGVDTQPEASLHHFFTGAQISERVDFCFDGSSNDSLLNKIEAVRLGQFDAQDFLQDLEETRSSNCGYSLFSLLTGVVVPEWIETDILDMGAEQKIARFRRMDRISLSESLFLDLTKDAQLYDVPLIAVRDHMGTLQSKEFWHRNEFESVRTYSLLDRDPVETEIQGPVLGSSDAVRVYPRRYRFLISGLKFSLDTGEGLARVGSGLLFKSLGDRYRRSFSIGLTLENSEAVTEGAFSLDLRTLFADSRKTSLQLERGQGVFDINTTPVSIGIGLRSPLEEESNERASPFAFFSVGVGRTNGDNLVPLGFQLNYLVRREADLEGDLDRDGYQELRLNVWQPIGRLTTFIFVPAFGRSDNVKLLSDYLPGSASTRYASQNFISTSTQIQSVIFSNINVDILGSVLFQDLVIFAAHHSASSADIIRASNIFSSNLQTASFGLRFFGSFFGAKNQSLSVSILRSLTDRLGNSFVLTLGAE